MIRDEIILKFQPDEKSAECQFGSTIWFLFKCSGKSSNNRATEYFIEKLLLSIRLHLLCYQTSYLCLLRQFQWHRATNFQNAERIFMHNHLSTRNAKLIVKQHQLLGGTNFVLVRELRLPLLWSLQFVLTTLSHL